MDVDYNLDSDDLKFIEDKFPTLYEIIKPYITKNKDKLIVPTNLTDKIDEEFAMAVADYGIKNGKITEDGIVLEDIIYATLGD